MATFRYPGIICQTRDWYDDLDDGTLARMPSPLPSVVGSPSSSGVAQATTQVVASGVCSYLNPRLRGTVIAPPSEFDRLRTNSGAARISVPQEIASHTWMDRGSHPAVAYQIRPAVEQQIQIDGRTIRVIRPTDTAAGGKNLPTTVQVAEGLRAIPAGQRAYTNCVVIIPTANPHNEPGKTIAGEGGAGEILLFPVNSPQSQNDFDNRITHESGHNYQGSLWQSAQAVQEWSSVRAADNNYPSRYAQEGDGEDFCEFIVLYNTARGTACEAAARQIYPNRWLKMLDYQSR